MLYALDAHDVIRLRKLLIAFEQGRLSIDVPPPPYPSQAGRQDSFFAYVSANVQPGQTGSAALAYLDGSNPPIISAPPNTFTFKVYNPGPGVLPAGYTAIVREPSWGYFIPALQPQLVYWYQCTSSTSQSVSAGGLTVTAYPATIWQQSLATGALTNTTNSAWIVPVNSYPNESSSQYVGQYPTVNSFYQGHYFGSDGSNVPAYWIENYDLNVAPNPLMFSWSGGALTIGGAALILQTLTLPIQTTSRTPVGPVIRTTPLYQILGAMQVTATGGTTGSVTVTVGVQETGPVSTQLVSVTGKFTTPKADGPITVTIPIVGYIAPNFSNQGNTTSVTLQLYAQATGDTTGSASVASGSGVQGSAGNYPATGFVAVTQIPNVN